MTLDKARGRSTLQAITSFPAGRSLMETPLTPLEFVRRARKVHGAREAVVDGLRRFTYAAVLRPLRRLGGRARLARRRQGRSRRDHRARIPINISSSSTRSRNGAP